MGLRSLVVFGHRTLIRLPKTDTRCRTALRPTFYVQDSPHNPSPTSRRVRPHLGDEVCRREAILKIMQDNVGYLVYRAFSVVRISGAPSRVASGVYVLVHPSRCLIGGLLI